MVSATVGERNPPSRLDLTAIRAVAEHYGLREVYFNSRSRIISFRRYEPPVRWNVYYTTGTVSTALYHPRSGPTQLFRKNYVQSGTEYVKLASVFMNPRAHTGEGYYEKSPRKERRTRADVVQAEKEGRTLFVGNVPYRIRATDLYAEFEVHGNVERIFLGRDWETLSPKGYAFVQFGTASGAMTAMQAMNGAVVMGRVLRVSPRKGKPAKR